MNKEFFTWLPSNDSTTLIFIKMVFTLTISVIKFAFFKIDVFNFTITASCYIKPMRKESSNFTTNTKTTERSSFIGAIFTILTRSIQNTKSSFKNSLSIITKRMRNKTLSIVTNLYSILNYVYINSITMSKSKFVNRVRHNFYK